MADRATIGLDNPAFQGRLRQPERMQFARAAANRRPVRYQQRINDVQLTQAVTSTPPPPQQPTFPRPRLLVPATEQVPAIQIVPPQPFAKPAQRRQQPSNVLKRYNLHFPARNNAKTLVKKVHRPTKLQFGLVGMAVVVFGFGIFSSLQTIKTNHAATTQVAVLASKANSNPVSAGAAAAAVVPSTTKPTASALSNYVVAPSLPRYLKIPKLGVDARILQVGVTSSGALGTPPNVYDTAWYTGSAEPGQPGATLIDGHVSSWTANGVFYGLKLLAPGDLIQIVRGDGTVFNYQVVKTQVYSSSDVNMQAAMTPITPGVPGLNLITCTGDVIPGTSLFNERMVVFAQQV